MIYFLSNWSQSASSDESPGTLKISFVKLKIQFDWHQIDASLPSDHDKIFENKEQTELILHKCQWNIPMSASSQYSLIHSIRGGNHSLTFMITIGEASQGWVLVIKVILAIKL